MTIPTLQLFGSADPAVDSSVISWALDSSYVSHSLKRASMLDATHWLHAEKPKEVCRLVDSFLAEVKEYTNEPGWFG